MIRKFVGRKKELKEIHNKLNSSNFEFLVIYGRRRIGKTTLVLEATKNPLYYFATQEQNLDRIYSTFSKKYPKLLNLKQDWEILFDFLKDKNETIIIDEFQNLIQENKNILSIFQNIIDNILKNTKTKIIITGSSQSIFNSKILSYKSPLFGRRTYSLKLEKMSFSEVKEFTNNKNSIETYGFCDGIPYYLEKIDKPFWDYLKLELNNKGTYLKDEIDFLMRYEFDNTNVYKSILKAIAHGKNRLTEIKDFLNLKKTDITPYLKNLIETDFIQRKIPYGDNENSRKGRYFLKDNFIKFYFKFVYPNLESIEQNIFDINIIKKNYNQYLGFVFEDICKQHLTQTKEYNKISSWWNKDQEIDIIAETEKEVLICECKFKENVDSEKIYNSLKDKFKTNKKIKYAVFAKSFTKKTNLIKQIDINMIK